MAELVELSQQLQGLPSNKPTFSQDGDLLSLYCPLCVYVAMPLGTQSLSPGYVPSAVVAIVNTTIMCVKDVGSGQVQPATLAMVAVVSLVSGVTICLALAIAMRWRFSRRRTEDGVGITDGLPARLSEPGGLVVGVPLPHAVGEHMKGWDVEAIAVHGTEADAESISGVVARASAAEPVCGEVLDGSSIPSPRHSVSVPNRQVLNVSHV
jgi:hypothetical protein